MMALDWDKESVESDADDYSGCQKKSTYIYKNGIEYEGEWKDEMRHGYGV